MMTEGFQEDLLLLHHHHHFPLQAKPPVSEGKTMMMMKMVKMMKICFSLLPDLVVRQQGTLLLVECAESLKEVYAGR